MKLSAYLDGIGVLGPGLANWSECARILEGERSYVSAPSVLPVPAMLPPAERRRTGRVVKLALAVALEATTAAASDLQTLASVFSSSGSDGHICHEICEALAQSTREVSPTRFSNSVHNASAGYWNIGTGSMTESNVLCAFDASFIAGLLESMTQCAVDKSSVLLVAYDTEYPPPLHAKRPIPDAFGIAMVFSPAMSPHSIARLQLSLTDDPADSLSDAGLESLRRAIPAARGLPLLRLLASRAPGNCVLDYLDVARAAVHVQPCH
jgi:Beta-ketoacyl synthase, N-terminal domain